MIEVNELVKWYGPWLALDRISFQVPKGKIVGFLGPNGAGKTTTIRILTCFMPPSDGQATVMGHSIEDSESVRRCIGYLPENTPLYPELRVEEHLHYFGKLHGVSRAIRKTRIEELAERCSLQEIRKRPIGQLSKGNRQRVGLAQALLHDPAVLILDEPTAGLDPTQITQIRQLIREIAGEKTVLLSTHILPEAEKICDEVVIINYGKIVAAGTPRDLLAAMRRQGSHIIVEIKAEPAEVQRLLKAVPSVSEVEVHQHDGWCRARVTARGDDDLREALGQVITTHRWPVRELRAEGGTLEEVFVHLTSGERREHAA